MNNGALIITNNMATVYHKGVPLVFQEITNEQIERATFYASIGDWDKVVDAFTNVFGDFDKKLFTMSCGNLYLNGVGKPIPEDLIPYITKGKKYRRFWKLAALNPNSEARTNLFQFLLRHDFKITKNGYFVAYREVVTTDKKGVYTDYHTGTMKIRMKEVVKMDRSLCNENQNDTCSSGLHVGGSKWISKGSFGNVGITCLINPMHVVAVPPSEDYGKMRVCQYYPIMKTRFTKKKKVIPIKQRQMYMATFSEHTIAEIDALLTRIAYDPSKINVLGLADNLLTAREAISKMLIKS